MKGPNILEMGREELLALDPEDVLRRLTPEEVVHIARTLGAFWSYDYEAAKRGKPGKHAELKSKLHSDGFFVSKILLEPRNILLIIARQIAMRVREYTSDAFRPDYVAGIPDGATSLGEEIARLLGADSAKMAKINGRISFQTQIRASQSLLLVEDFCTRGTGFTEGVLEAKKQSPRVLIVSCNPCIINRGGLVYIDVDGAGRFVVLPAVERRIQDWDPKDSCPLCEAGSVAINPKATDENWQALLASQK